MSLSSAYLRAVLATSYVVVKVWKYILTVNLLNQLWSHLIHLCIWMQSPVPFSSAFAADDTWPLGRSTAVLSWAPGCSARTTSLHASALGVAAAARPKHDWNRRKHTRKKKQSGTQCKRQEYAFGRFSSLPIIVAHDSQGIDDRDHITNNFAWFVLLRRSHLTALPINNTTQHGWTTEMHHIGHHKRS